MLRQRNATWASRYSAAPPSSAVAGHERQRASSTCVERLLEPERDQHDAGDHREVQVGERVARDLVAAPGPARRSPAGARRRAPRRRSTATTARAATAVPSTAATTTPASTPRLGADADRDDRLAERDDHDQPVALGEVARHELPAARVRTRTARRCRARSAIAHSAPCSVAVGERRRRPAGRRRSPCSTASPTTDWRRPGSSRLASMNSAMCAAAHDAVRAREQQRVVAERVRARTAPPRAAPPSPRTSPGGPRPPRGRRRSSATRSRPTPTTARRATSRPFASPAHVGSCAISAVHCVSASTNTRSKNSSSGVTRSSSRRTAVRCGRRMRRRGAHGPHPLISGAGCAPGSPCGSAVWNARERARRSAALMPSRSSLRIASRRPCASSPAAIAAATPQPGSPAWRAVGEAAARRRRGDVGERVLDARRRGHPRQPQARRVDHAARRPRARTARGASSRGARARRTRAPPASAGAPRRAGGSRACSCRRRTCRRARACGPAPAAPAARHAPAVWLLDAVTCLGWLFRRLPIHIFPRSFAAIRRWHGTVDSMC